VVKCAECGAELPAMPGVLEGAVVVKCRKCFGTAPKAPASSMGEILEKLRESPEDTLSRSEEAAETTS